MVDVSIYCSVLYNFLILEKFAVDTYKTILPSSLKQTYHSNKSDCNTV